MCIAGRYAGGAGLRNVENLGDSGGERTFGDCIRPPPVKGCAPMEDVTFPEGASRW